MGMLINVQGAAVIPILIGLVRRLDENDQISHRSTYQLKVRS